MGALPQVKMVYLKKERWMRAPASTTHAVGVACGVTGGCGVELSVGCKQSGGYAPTRSKQQSNTPHQVTGGSTLAASNQAPIRLITNGLRHFPPHTNSISTRISTRCTYYTQPTEKPCGMPWPHASEMHTPA